ncbi:hypothetical protein M378DRAFT_156427 [Amanita muscaria Koide BX008]|uniref:Cora-domain-containing protein n=1 Tax=Amanita muscaria (strain Koide BX008) TaxID=946122 RepID=A0A0C2XMF1_AMAMK|nr:hypothetical protein M378DRAFT_156427 [Amanita muscaria Koide BX008]
MTSSEDESQVLSSSPRAFDTGDHVGARHLHAFPSSLEPHDYSQVRERQRTMDVDMAFHLSRARRETILHSPVASVRGPPSPEITFAPVPNLSVQGEKEILIARGRASATPDVAMDLVDDETVQLQTSSSVPSLLDPCSRHAHIQTDVSTLLEGHISPPQALHAQEDTIPRYDLPTYQADAPRSIFDFTKMEDFASKEKANLGISSPFSLRARPRPPTAARSADVPPPPRLPSPPHLSEMSSPPILAAESGVPSSPTQFGSPTNAPDDATRLLRHRKLSQSNPQPRVHRKGIGGRLALFENNGGDSVQTLSQRLGAVLGGSSNIQLGGPDHFVPSSARQGGMLNTGHDRPFRFTFYSNSLAATIHARSLSELPADGQSFKDLFSGVHPPDDTRTASRRNLDNHRLGPTSSNDVKTESANGYEGYDARSTPNGDTDNITWWLDVTSPTEEEMKMLSEVFSIHPLTSEDILMEETREKIELFRNYYFVCFRGFDQDRYSPTYLEPLNMYIIVFREGILSFHFQPTPHPQNVRRRIKQFKDYISVTSDWISYALIDDITDAFGPLIQSIEYEVDSIDELVLILKEAEQCDMLRRIGTCRKKVMGLLRLMGNKADVVKGLAKRCNENWRVAPTSDIGLYLSDIQDHLITMTQNLNHYEKILSRSHSNYLAQISIEMTDANNQINDVLSKLTALGTILIPMNLVTGLWGMNVHVPGQDVPGYGWFIAIIACLAAFALLGGYSTYRFMVRK